MTIRLVFIYRIGNMTKKNKKSKYVKPSIKKNIKVHFKRKLFDYDYSELLLSQSNEEQ